MSRPVQKVALIGATGTLGSHILKALVGGGYTVTAVQRKESTKSAPSGVASVKVDLTNKGELVSAFKGQDAVISATPNPVFTREKVWIDAAIAASVRRIVPSEYSTNLENPLARKLPMVKGKAEVRDYITSMIPGTTSTTTWTSINNGPFFDMCLRFGVLGPNLAQKKAVFHNGGDNMVGASRLSDIGISVAKVLDAPHFDETANQPVYMYSTVISERYLTQLASEVTGIDFGSVEGGTIPNLDTEQLIREADEKLARGDMSAMFLYYFQMMYGKGYEGDTTQISQSWIERLGLKTMTEDDLKEAIRAAAKELGVVN